MSFIIYNISWNTFEFHLNDEFKKYGIISMIQYVDCSNKKKPNICYLKYSKLNNINKLINSNIFLHYRKLKVVRYYHNSCKWQKNIENNVSKNPLSITSNLNNNLNWQQKLLLNVS